MASWIGVACQLGALIVLGACALSDIRERRIANQAVAWGLALALAAAATGGLAVLGGHLLAASVALAVGLAAWAFGTVGGGDAKLAAAAAALVGWHALLAALLLFALVSGAWALFVAVRAALRRDPNRTWQRMLGIHLLLPSQVTLPLAVPMAASALVVLTLSHLAH